MKPWPFEVALDGELIASGTVDAEDAREALHKAMLLATEPCAVSQPKGVALELWVGEGRVLQVRVPYL